MSKEQMDQLRQDWSKMCLGAASLVVEVSPVQILLQNMIELLCHQCEVMEDIRSELRQMNETDPDAEPDPFQTLNGPRGVHFGWTGGGSVTPDTLASGWVDPEVITDTKE